MRTLTNTDGHGPTPTRLRMAHQDALAAARDVMAMLAPNVERSLVAGSLRRGRDTVGDIDIVAIPKAGGAIRIAQALRELHCGAASDFRAGDKLQSAVVGHGPNGLCGPGGRQEREAQVDVYMATAENWGMILCCRTGSAQHNVWMAKMARTMGMKFAAGTGIETAKDAKNAKGRTEEEVFGALGLTVPEPRLREIVRGHPVWMD